MCQSSMSTLLGDDRGSTASQEGLCAISMILTEALWRVGQIRVSDSAFIRLIGVKLPRRNFFPTFFTARESSFVKRVV